MLLEIEPSKDATRSRSRPKVRLGCLVAASHSGSTLLAMALGAHPEACTVGELKANSFVNPDEYLCSCREKIKDCSFWLKIRDSMARYGFPNFDITRVGSGHGSQSHFVRRLLSPLHRGPILEFVRDAALSFSPQWREELAATQSRTVALGRSLLDITGAKVVIDSSKVALRLKYLLRNPELDIRMIHVIRDGRAVAMTYMDEWTYADASDPALRGGGVGVRRAPPRTNMRDAANEWKRSNEAAECLLKAIPPDSKTEVRYEELCANPTQTLSRLSTFLSLDPDKVNLDFRSRTQHVIGNGMRMDMTSEIRLDERWKTVLTKDNLRDFHEVAGDLNRRYGYK